MTTVRAIDLASLLKGVPRGEWAVISSDMGRLVAHGEDMEMVLDKAKELGEKNPVILRVPEPSVALFL